MKDVRGVKSRFKGALFKTVSSSVIICLIGIVLMILSHSQYLSEEVTRAISLEIGAVLFTIGFVEVLYEYYIRINWADVFLSGSQFAQNANKLGFRNIIFSPSETNTTLTVELMNKSSKSIIITGYTLPHILTQLQDSLINSLSKNKRCNVEIFILSKEDPFFKDEYSCYLKDREEQESSLKTDFKNEYDGAIEKVKRIENEARKNGYNGSIELYAYNRTPYNSLIIYDMEVVLYCPYFNERKARLSPIYEIHNDNSELFQIFIKHYEFLKNDKRTKMIYPAPE